MLKIKDIKIALIGFRATGKTLVGKTLAQKLRWPFIDMDVQLTTAFGQDIDAYVRSHGWESFRDAESDLLKTLVARERCVVSTGGGIIERATNREILAEHFVVIWLRAAPETIQTRLQQDPLTSANRPPLTHLPMEKEILEVLQRRTPLYEESADLVLDADSATPQELVSRVEAFLERFCSPLLKGDCDSSRRKMG